MFKQNEHLIDRLLRGLLAAILLVVSYFWLSGALAVVLYIASGLMVVTAITGFCGLYPILKINTKESFASPKTIFVWILGLLIALVLVAGSYGSIFVTKKIFLEDFNLMNNYYKQTLFNTGQEKRAESIDNYDKLLTAYAAFLAKYEKYQPVSLRYDNQFVTDINKVDSLIKSVEAGVRTGDLKTTHTELEAIRPVWQEMFKHNGFSMLAVTLVDFHDAMEKVLDPANLGDAVGVINFYPEADAKLKAVEEEANDSEIQAIRAELDKILQMANDKASKDELVKQAAVLKASFVKVYLKRG